MQRITLVTGALGSVMLLAVLGGCQDRATYPPKDVEIVSERAGGEGITITFRPKAESIFDCPGVRFATHGPSIEFEQASRHRTSVIHYEYVRSQIRQNEPVDIKAKYVKDGSLSVTFPYPGGRWEKGDRIVLFDSSGNRRTQIDFGSEDQRQHKR
jgi:hypothetical protein